MGTPRVGFKEEREVVLEPGGFRSPYVQVVVECDYGDYEEALRLLRAATTQIEKQIVDVQ